MRKALLMDLLSKGKGKKGNLIIKTWERCKSIGRGLKGSSSGNSHVLCCFSVYVGAQKQRFVIKTEYANHPLFKILLEEAESEYGFNSEGPLVLPCNVDLFCKVLLAMGDGDNKIRQGCSFAKGYGS
ncbi:hypothetical protein CRYUN_Cryun18bG0045800 [Craigia yunnanensis]